LRSGAQTVAGFLAELLGVLWWLGRERGGRIREVQGARRRRGSEGKEIFHGGSGFYPRSVVFAADEDARATLRRQAAAWPGAWRHWTQRLCSGGRASPLLKHCSDLYPTSFVVLQNSPKF